jgi:hypothetical protein
LLGFQFSLAGMRVPFLISYSRDSNIIMHKSYSGLRVL